MYSRFSSVQFSSVAQSCPILHDPMNRSTPGLPVHHHLRSSLRLTSIESMMPSSHLIFGRPLLLPPVPPSIRVFSNESTLAWGGQSNGASALASFLPKIPRAALLQNGQVGSPCSPRDSQESYSTPQFKSINYPNPNPNPSALLLAEAMKLACVSEIRSLKLAPTNQVQFG